MKLETKIPCQVCGKRTDRIATHEKCLARAVYLTTLDDLDAVFSSDTVIAVADSCYLCGNPLGAEGGHADHVYPKSAGGSDHWSNIGATHRRCNLVKHAKIGITDEQQERLDCQHSHLRAVASCIDDGIWYQVLVNEIGNDAGFLIDDVEYLSECLDEWFEDTIRQPPVHVRALFLQMVMDPDVSRDTESKSRLGFVLDSWRAESDAADALWEAAHEGWTKEEVVQEALDNLETMRASLGMRDNALSSKDSGRSKWFGFFRKS